jgi:hypothetical protein
VTARKRNNMSNILFLYQRYFFWKDMEDFNRANYWLSRIKEYEQIQGGNK